jgi:hypothetical protein
MLWRGPPEKCGSANVTLAVSAASGRVQRTRQPTSASDVAIRVAAWTGRSHAALRSTSGCVQPNRARRRPP